MATEAMETEDTPDPLAVPSSPAFMINVLQEIKKAQGEHGARYNDFQRYRTYCKHRLRRLYKSLRFLHGRGRYIHKTIEAPMVTDVRFLHIPLYLAERAWAYAMELKSIETGPDLSRKRAHLIRRITRAARWGDLFAHLCAAKADSKTALEAEAYASYMWGQVLLEKESDLQTALTKFLRVKAVYQQLGEVGEVSHQVLCRERVEEMEPHMRYCRYQLGDLPGGEAALQAPGTENPTLGLLQAKLEAVMEEARAQQAATMSELQWLGRKLPVLNAATRVKILKAQELEAALAESGGERQLGLFDKLFVTYQDAVKEIRKDMVVAGGSEDVRGGLAALERAVGGLLLERTLDRNLALVQQAQARMGGGGGEKEKPTRPEDLVRLHDTCMQNVVDLRDLLATQHPSAQEGDHSQWLAARWSALQAARCRYVAQSYAAAKKLPEAYVLFSRAAEEAAGALKQYGELEAVRQDEVAALEALSVFCRSQRCLVHAKANLESVMAEEGLDTRVAEISLKNKKGAQTQVDLPYMLDALDTYQSALRPPGGGKSTAPRVARIPPPFQAVPVRPIVMDEAGKFIQFPNLHGKTTPAPKAINRWGLGSFFTGK